LRSICAIEPSSRSISDIVASAYKLHASFEHVLRNDSTLTNLLQKLDRNIEISKNEMVTSGIVQECADCAVNGEGTCCGVHTGYKCDRVLILINLLLGVSVHIQTQEPHLCAFLTKHGCSLSARPVICVNLTCHRLSRNIPHEKLARAQRIVGEELTTLFMIEEHIKKRIKTAS
jgi:hypothetical protein